MTLKSHHISVFMSPAGYWITVRELDDKPKWLVRVLDFATWKHRRFEFDTEAEARTEADRWRL